jgi:antitoxin (DNA-binding transcriptional repressor) of toxin-antitoxin stability system
MPQYNLLSVKELRTAFPLVQKKLLAGQSFILLHRSKPIAKLNPIKAQEAISGLDFWANPKEENLIKNKKIDVVKLIRDDRD